MAKIETERQFDYYTPSPQQQRNGFGEKKLAPEKENKLLKRLAQKCLYPFLEANDERRIKLFTDGTPPYYPTESADVRSRFVEEAEKVVSEYCQNYLDQSGTILPSRQQDWNNLSEIAPELVAIIANRKNYVSLVDKSDALNIIGAAILKAQQPETPMVIRIGIGGSDDEFTSARFPAYGIPAFRIAEQINSFYDGRKKRVLRGAAIDKAIASHQNNKGTEPLTKEERSTIAASTHPDQGGNYPGLTEDEHEEVLKRYSVSNNPVKIQFFIAHHAAIAVNHESKNIERIQQRSQDNVSVLKEYVAKHHPALADRIEITEDIHWDAISIHAKNQLEYLADELRKSNDPSIQKTLAILEKLGKNHGGNNGADKAAEYAAGHPLTFGDRLNLPNTRFLQEAGGNPQILLTIGCSTERLFCAVRDYLRRNADPERFDAFLARKIEQTQDADGKEPYVITKAALEKWQRMIDIHRERFYDGNPDSNSIPRPDLPVHEAQLITNIGSKPPYYATEYDRPYGTDLVTHLAQIREAKTSLKHHGETLKRQGENPNTREQLRKLSGEIHLVEGVEFDLVALKEDQTQPR